MRTRSFLVLLGLTFPVAAAGVASLGGCGQVLEVPPSLDGGGAHDGGHPSGSSGGGSGPADAAPDYVDPGCPDAGPPLKKFACDPYNQHNGDCPPGDGCYIFTQNPMMPCGQETYGSICSAAGTGKQGAPCNGAQGCGAGFACVVSGSGDQCVQLCQLAGSTSCPPGLVCEPIDVQGFGGCL